MPDLHVDMEELAREIRLVDTKWAAHIRRDLRAAVAESGSAITAAVKAEASWSKGTPHKKQPGRTSIPNATSLGMTFGAKSVGVVVKVNSKKAPHARPLELGNSTSFDGAVIEANGGFKVGRDGKRRAANRSIYASMRKSGVGVGRGLKHPVYGNKGKWVSQAIRPFFFAAIETMTPEVEAKIQAAIDMVAFKAGFKGR